MKWVGAITMIILIGYSIGDFVAYYGNDCVNYKGRLVCGNQVLHRGIGGMLIVTTYIGYLIFKSRKKKIPGDFGYSKFGKNKRSDDFHE